jgi:hypothetical protein
MVEGNLDVEMRCSNRPHLYVRHMNVIQVERVVVVPDDVINSVHLSARISAALEDVVPDQKKTASRDAGSPKTTGSCHSSITSSS